MPRRLGEGWCDMNSTQYTLGPWRYQSNGKNRYNVVHDWQRGGIGASIAQQILRAPDARLIAAAPDMAEALIIADVILRRLKYTGPEREMISALAKAI